MAEPNFCMQFKLNRPFNSELAQFNIKYKPQKEQLQRFLDKYGSGQQRVNICFEETVQESDIDLILSFKEYNIALRFLNERIDDKILDKLIENNIPYFFKIYASDWDTFRGLINLGVSDIWITESLGFDLYTVRNVADKYGIRIRAYCNVCQSSWDDTDSIKTFFIRPEDVDLYAEFIDVFEFFDDGKRNLDVLYDIYAHDKKWMGKLNEIITNYYDEDNNIFFTPDFSYRRIRCQKKCFSDGYCHMCETSLQLGKELQKKGVYITHDKVIKEDNINGEGDTEQGSNFSENAGHVLRELYARQQDSQNSNDGRWESD